MKPLLVNFLLLLEVVDIESSIGMYKFPINVVDLILNHGVMDVIRTKEEDKCHNVALFPLWPTKC